MTNTIRNNECVGEFLKTLKKSKTQYKTLNKKEERELINKYLTENKEDELRKLLILHNIRLVFSIAKKYCKNTVDFDNMFSKGLYGLTIAANRFNFFELVKAKIQIGLKPVMEKTNPKKQKINEETGELVFKPIYEKRIWINPLTCKTEYIKFSTYANPWVFKYIVDEFEHKSILIDNNSISIDDDVRIKNSTDNNQTMENYIDSMVSPDYNKPKTVMETISDNETSVFYKNIGEYIKNTNELTAIEKQIIVDTFYNNKKVDDISRSMSLDKQNIMLSKKNAFEKIKTYLSNNFKISSFKDIELM